MKTIMFIIGIAALVSLNSCRKDWTCACVNDNGDKSYSTIPDASLSDAKRTCDKKEYDVLGTWYQNCSVEK